MSNFDKLLSDAKAKALACVGATGFTFDNDQIVSAFGEIEKIMLEVGTLAQAQAKAEAEVEVNAANEWFKLVDETFKACPSRFLWKRGKSVLMVVASNKTTSNAAEAEFAQQLAPLGDVKRYLNSQTMGRDTEVFYTSVELKGLGLLRNLDASEYGGIYQQLTAGLASVLSDDG
jgi:hypothetical protein